MEKKSHPPFGERPLTIACHMKKSYLAAEEGAASVVEGVVVVGAAASVVDGATSVVVTVSVVAGVVSVVDVVSLLLQAAKAVAIAKTKKSFFMFLFF